MQGVAFDKQKVMKALEPYFKLGYTIRKACILAGFDQSLISKWIDQEPELSLQIEALQGIVKTKARQVVIKAIESGDLATAKWYLERAEREDFGKLEEQKLEDRENKIDKIIVEYVDSKGNLVERETRDNGTEGGIDLKVVTNRAPH